MHHRDAWIAGARILVLNGHDIRPLVTIADLIEPIAVAMAGVLPAGAHLDAVGGSMPYLRELQPDCVLALAFFTDYRHSLEAQAGEVIDARTQGLVPADWQATETGEVIAGTRPGRTSAAQRTIYRLLGVAAQHLAAADFIAARAAECRVGSRLRGSDIGRQ